MSISRRIEKLLEETQMLLGVAKIEFVEGPDELTEEQLEDQSTIYLYMEI